MKFIVGEKAFYPAFGVCVVRNIESQEFGGLTQDFYVLEMQKSGNQVRVPTGSVSSTMRKLISTNELDSIYDILKTPRRVVQKNWNRRQKEFRDKLRGGTMVEIAAVVKEIAAMRTEKGLSSGARDIFDSAMNMVVQEISAVSDRAQDDVKIEISSLVESLA